MHSSLCATHTYLVVLEAHALPLAVLVDVAAQRVVVAPPCPVVLLAAERNAAEKQMKKNTVQAFLIFNLSMYV